MKIVYYTDQTYLHGGIEKILSFKANYLSNLKEFEVTILTNEQKKNKPCYEFYDNIKHVDLNINYVRELSNLHPKNFIKIFNNFFKLKSFLNKYKPDVLVVCNYNFDYFFIPFINKNKTLKIREMHDSRYYPTIKRKSNKSLIRKLIYKFSDYIENKYDYFVVLSNDEREYYTGNNVKVIPNFIPKLKTRIIQPFKERKNIVISAGRICSVKGFDQLINAWKFVADKNKDWKLHIYGDGDKDYVKFLNELIISFSLQNWIKLKGSTTKLPEKMAEASIYVMSSVTECFPMVLLEAMQVELPIVSFDCPHGPRNIITHENDGFIVKNKDIIALSDQINLLIKNQDLREKLGRNAGHNVKKFNEKLVMNDWIKLFKHNEK
jgi:glycosyltransferase involved in cell wall biosynthesis